MMKTRVATQLKVNFINLLRANFFCTSDHNSRENGKEWDIIWTLKQKIALNITNDRNKKFATHNEASSVNLQQ